MADTRVYVLLGDTTDTDSYFRVSPGGVYDRWNDTTRTWDHVTDPVLRDFYSRSIQSGNDVVRATPAQIARLH